MQPWINRKRIRAKYLNNSLRVIDLERRTRIIISDYLDDYLFLGGQLFWKEDDIPKLQKCLLAILHISMNEFSGIVSSGNADVLRSLIKKKTVGFSDQEIEEICFVLTMGPEGKES